MRVLAVIPARLGSSRLARKVLLSQTGKPLVQHVYEAVARCSAIESVVVATDADEVTQAVRSFGGDVVLTSTSCQSGTDRVAEAARKLPAADLIINVQGDEPEMSREPLEALIDGMRRRSDAVMGTVATPWPEGTPHAEPSVVKVVVDQRGDALYFSRSAIPFYRQPHDAPPPLKHVGLYAFRPQFLQTFTTLAPTPLERCEGLEQLRALEHGYRIAVFVAPYSGQEVNTPEDYAAFVARCRASVG